MTKLPIRKSHPIFQPVNSILIDLSTPLNLSSWWNFGSLLGFALFSQILTGLFLTMHYAPSVALAFSSVIHISQDVNFGWLIRSLHANGASMFFIAIYAHMGRGMYYASFMKQEVWLIGLLLLILTMATAFVGYVLPWGQMSFWGATVITNLLSAIPYIGPQIVTWLWGGFAVDNATLNRFFMFHFLLPFILVALSGIHILFLHQEGSTNPLGLSSSPLMIPFHPFYSSKDIVGMILFALALMATSLMNPAMFLDPENFIPANPLSTPTHIKPEWYFLWAYTILRSIPSKLGGVIAMFSAILIPASLPFTSKADIKNSAFCPPAQIMFWFMTVTLLTLTWIGGCPVEYPYESIGRASTTLFFLYFIIVPPTMTMWCEFIKKWKAT